MNCNKISIIIPCYNCSKTIIRTLNSIVPQLRQGDEVILVDDCSTDDTVDVVYDYIKRPVNVRFFRQEDNQGPANARNIGIRESIGDYIGFMDSDDTVESNYINLIVEAINEHNADLISIRIQGVYGSKVIPLPRNNYKDKADFMAMSNGSLCGIIASKKLWANLLLPDIKNAEDIAVIPILISRSNCIHHIKEPLYNYIHTNNSLSRKAVSDISINFQKSFDYTIARVDYRKYYESIEFHGIKTIIYGGILNSIKSGSPKYQIIKMQNDFENVFPDWHKNRYIEYYPFRKKIFLFFVHKRMYISAHIYVFLHEMVLRLRTD